MLAGYASSALGQKRVARLEPSADAAWIARQQQLTAEAVSKGILIELNQEKLPGCYYHRSHTNDVARVEQCTYICTQTRDQAGPTNNWAPPKEM